MGAPRVEVLTVTPEDGDAYAVVFIDGEQVTPHASEDVDPGRGYDEADWDEHTAHVAEQARAGLYSPAFTATVLAERATARGSRYVTGWAL